MERRHVSDAEMLPGYDALQFQRVFASESVRSIDHSATNERYEDYYRIHKVYVGQSGARLLQEIHDELRIGESPKHLNAAGWCAAEAALVDDSLPAVARMSLMRSAEDSWERAMAAQEEVNTGLDPSEIEDDAVFRLALNLAFAPLMKSMIAGNITDSIREQVFADVLALAQLAGIQRKLAHKNGNLDAVGHLLGFEHECNAHLALLHIDDARYVPLPSSARGGSGTTYPEQTHDIVVVNQHWGKIRKVIPLEIKSKASLGDIKRYDALVVRGKMHLSITGRYSPEFTREAFAAYYDDTATRRDNLTVYQVTSTMKELLRLYQQGNVRSKHDSPTSYHDFSALQRSRPEFSLNRPEKYV
jgi:hypothetical protein